MIIQCFYTKCFNCVQNSIPGNPGSIIEICLIFHPLRAHCTALADFNVNVLDISQTVMQGYFTMMMATEVSACNVPLGELVTRMDEIGKEMGLSIRVQREDIFEAMHRI